MNGDCTDIDNLVDKITLGWFHRYPARFSKETIIDLFKGVCLRYGKIPPNILDPFSGTGATLSFAKQLGIDSFGIELTKLGLLVSRVRLNPPDDLDQAYKRSVNLVKNYKEKFSNNDKKNKDLRDWIGKNNVKKTTYLLNEINQIPDPKLQDWLKVALSSSLRPSSRWLPGSIKPQKDPKRKSSDILSHFVYFSGLLKKDCENESVHFSSSAQACINFGDSKKLPLPDSSIYGVITSPPYASMYDYVDVHRLSYLAFNWEFSRESQIGIACNIPKDGESFCPPKTMIKLYFDDLKGENTIEGRSLRKYFLDIEEHLSEIYRVIYPGSYIGYVVANSIKKGKEFLLVDSLSELIEKNGFSDVDIIRRNGTKKRILPAGRNIKTGKFDSSSLHAINEHIIFARKPLK